MKPISSPLHDPHVLNSKYEAEFVTSDESHKEKAKQLNIAILHRTVLNTNPYQECAQVVGDDFKVFMQAQELKDIVLKATGLEDLRIYRTNHLLNGQRIFSLVSDNMKYNYVILFTTEFDGWPNTKERNICK